MWSPQMELLSATHRVLRFDTRGHGASLAPEGAYRMDDLVHDVVTLMDEVGIATADFLGLSLGGMVGLGLAIEHPHRIKTLICCGARGDAPDAYAQLWRDRVEVVMEQGISAVVDPTLERWFTPSFMEEPRAADIVALTRDMILTTSVEGYCGCAAALTRLDYFGQLSRIELPVLFIAGDEDQAAPKDVMRNMFEVTGNAEFAIVNGAAHLMNLEQPELFNAVVEPWLAHG